MRVTKGEETRAAIVEQAIRLASVFGLEGLTIGRLADQLNLSKSGLFAHFRSKEGLQVQTILGAKDRFVEHVVMPALKAPRGEKRIRALVDRWLEWGTSDGGCFFVAATVELDDIPGPARETLQRAQQDWLDALATATQIAIDCGDFRKDVDPKQFAFELYGLMLGAHHSYRFMRDPKAIARTKRAFDALIQRAK